MNLLLVVANNWRLILAALICLACFSAGWEIRAGIDERRQAKELAAAVEKHIEEQKIAAAHSAMLEAKLADLRTQTRKINQKLEAELAKNSIYSACRIPADGLQLLNEAIAGVPAR